MRVVITGASGLVGSNLAIQLVEAGHQVRCVRRRSSQTSHLSSLPIEWVEGDLSAPASLVAAFRGMDAVFHCAAVTGLSRHASEAMVRSNVEGTKAVIDASQIARISRLIHCSSVAAVAISEDGKPVTEDRPWNFDKFGLAAGYSVTKRESEALVRSAVEEGHLDAVIVNPCYMLGPYDPKPSTGQLVVNIVKGKVPGYTDGVNNFVDVRDVCRGMIAAWEKGRSGERYILGNRNMTYQEITRMIAQVAGLRPPDWRVPRPIFAVFGWLGDLQEMLTRREAMINSTLVGFSYCKGYLFSSEKAARELGYRPGPLEDAIRDAIIWFRKNGMLC